MLIHTAQTGLDVLFFKDIELGGREEEELRRVGRGMDMMKTCSKFSKNLQIFIYIRLVLKGKNNTNFYNYLSNTVVLTSKVQ